MSDLTASSCGCGNSTPKNNSCGCDILWIIILLSLCGGGNSCGCGSNGIFGLGGDGGNCCEWIIILLLLSCCGCGNGNGCGC